jgi:hypothetical protein
MVLLNHIAKLYCKIVLDALLKKCSELNQAAIHCDEHIEGVQLALNMRSMSKTGITPFQVMLGRNPFAKQVDVEIVYKGKLCKPQDLSQEEQRNLYMQR